VDLRLHCALCRSRMCMSGFASIVKFHHAHTVCSTTLHSICVRPMCTHWQDLRTFHMSWWIHMCTARSTQAIRAIESKLHRAALLHALHVFEVNLELEPLGYLDILVQDSSRAPPPSLLRALCYGTAASTSKSCLFHLPFGCAFRYSFVAD
jgi:hypothetical protein